MGHFLPAILAVMVLVSSMAGADEEELVDSQNKPSGVQGPCEAATCATHCKQQKHAGGRCDEETCVCQDFKNKGRCAMLGFGCGGGGMGNIGVGCSTCGGGGGVPIMPVVPVMPPLMPVLPPKPPCATCNSGCPNGLCGLGGMFGNSNSFVINRGDGGGSRMNP
ncbi:uncharacterized protein LOC113216373 [Frankliniella occidentalis]|uniref:Uncharacterized protein LOC113216373 n=1 Tax=Frankliniella occidentalis TaxID=133901 RepID=A0A6J1SRZ6_FRAOC|nr:uncharacterized protein LOC113216373 [Frankliniella occidentalis]